MVHMHITAWALGLILFFVAYSLYSAGRKGKGVHMGLRLMYIFIIVTGFMLYMSIVKTATGSMHMWYGLKNVSWYISNRWNGNGSCKMSKTNQQGRFGAYLLSR